MRISLLLPLLLLVCQAEAGRRRAPQSEAAAPAEATTPASPDAVPPRQHPAPYPGPLPRELGPVPEGLANPTAQACHACHPEVHGAWSASAHAGPPSDALREAATAAGDPACLACHLPLTSQYAEQPGEDGPVANPAWSPTMSLEGVGCASCHLHEGVVLSSEPPGPAPHRTAWAPALGASSFCASCHQLTWPGADAPFYDTFGEWSRSGWAKAGVTCQDCHMGPGAGAVRAGADHQVEANLARAVSLLVTLSAPELVRGGPTVTANITLQNTGAGHHLPSGSPWKGLRLEAALVRIAPDGRDLAAGVPFTADLVRTVSDAAPWTTLTDSRIPAGGETTWEVPLELSSRDPATTWWLRVRLLRIAGAMPTDAPPQVEQRIPIAVR